jgi:hypothetical protein
MPLHLVLGGFTAVSYASLPDTNLCLAATFPVWPAMLGDSLPIVKEITPRARLSIGNSLRRERGDAL